MSRFDAITPKEKQETFKRAFEIIKIYLDQKNYLAAYVVTFSILEDRIRALYVHCHISIKNYSPTQKQINGSLINIVLYLSRHDLFDECLVKKIKVHACQRNELMHASMWNLDVLTESTVDNLVKLVREVDSVARSGVRALKKSKIKILNE